MSVRHPVCGAFVTAAAGNEWNSQGISRGWHSADSLGRHGLRPPGAPSTSGGPDSELSKGCHSLSPPRAGGQLWDHPIPSAEASGGQLASPPSMVFPPISLHPSFTAAVWDHVPSTKLPAAHNLCLSSGRVPPRQRQVCTSKTWIQVKSKQSLMEF